MTPEQFQDLTKLMAKMASIYGAMDCKTAPLSGGEFDRGDFVVASVIPPWREEGLHCVQYSVMDGARTFVFGVSPAKDVAIANAEVILSKFSPADLSSAFRARRMELEEKRAAEQAEWKASCKLRSAVIQDGPKKVPRRRARIFHRSLGKCHYCATALDIHGAWHIEHKMPRALMGSNADENLVASCIPCNYKKRDKTDIEFKAELAAQGAA